MNFSTGYSGFNNTSSLTLKHLWTADNESYSERINLNYSNIKKKWFANLYSTKFSLNEKTVCK